jgi:TPR repeat protein
VPQDEAETLKWFRKAADQGNADSQFNVGIAYAQRLCAPHHCAPLVFRGLSVLPPQQPWQLGGVGGDAPGLVLGEQLGRASTRLILEIDVGERLLAGVADDETRPIQLRVWAPPMDQGGGKRRADGIEVVLALTSRLVLSENGE